MRMHRRYQPTGMTLVEVLAASVILGLAVTGLVFAAAASLRNQAKAQDRLAALYFANEKLAEVETLGPRRFAVSRALSGTEQRGAANYTWTIALDRLQEGELYRCSVTVQWQCPGSSGQTKLETLLNDYEAAFAETLEQQERIGGADANRQPPAR